MHELSLTEKIFKLVLEEARAHQAKRVNKIKITVGDFSGVVEDSVETYFRLIARDTIAGAAQLEFTRSRASLFCAQCGSEYEKQPGDFNCPGCGNLGKIVDTGQNCYVESIEVD
jgi:hydrogenase nickel incorporation protein HypA/HybF